MDKVYGGVRESDLQGLIRATLSEQLRCQDNPFAKLVNDRLGNSACLEAKVQSLDESLQRVQTEYQELFSTVERKCDAVHVDHRIDEVANLSQVLAESLRSELDQAMDLASERAAEVARGTVDELGRCLAAEAIDFRNQFDNFRLKTISDSKEFQSFIEAVEAKFERADLDGLLDRFQSQLRQKADIQRVKDVERRCVEAFKSFGDIPLKAETLRALDSIDASEMPTRLDEFVTLLEHKAGSADVKSELQAFSSGNEKIIALEDRVLHYVADVGERIDDIVARLRQKADNTIICSELQALHNSLNCKASENYVNGCFEHLESHRRAESADIDGRFNEIDQHLRHSTDHTVIEGQLDSLNHVIESRLHGAVESRLQEVQHDTQKLMQQKIDHASDKLEKQIDEKVKEDRDNIDDFVESVLDRVGCNYASKADVQQLDVFLRNVQNELNRRLTTFGLELEQGADELSSFKAEYEEAIEHNEEEAARLVEGLGFLEARVTQDYTFIVERLDDAMQCLHGKVDRTSIHESGQAPDRNAELRRQAKEVMDKKLGDFTEELCTDIYGQMDERLHTLSKEFRGLLTEEAMGPFAVRRECMEIVCEHAEGVDRRLDRLDRFLEGWKGESSYVDSLVSELQAVQNAEASTFEGQLATLEQRVQEKANSAEMNETIECWQQRLEAHDQQLWQKADSSAIDESLDDLDRRMMQKADGADMNERLEALARRLQQKADSAGTIARLAGMEQCLRQKVDASYVATQLSANQIYVMQQVAGYVASQQEAALLCDDVTSNSAGGARKAHKGGQQPLLAAPVEQQRYAAADSAGDHSGSERLFQSRSKGTRSTSELSRMDVAPVRASVSSVGTGVETDMQGAQQSRKTEADAQGLQHWRSRRAGASSAGGSSAPTAEEWTSSQSRRANLESVQAADVPAQVTPTQGCWKVETGAQREAQVQSGWKGDAGAQRDSQREVQQGQGGLAMAGPTVPTAATLAADFATPRRVSSHNHDRTNSPGASSARSAVVSGAFASSTSTTIPDDDDGVSPQKLDSIRLRRSSYGSARHGCGSRGTMQHRRGGQGGGYNKSAR